MANGRASTFSSGKVVGEVQEMTPLRDGGLSTMYLLQEEDGVEVKLLMEFDSARKICH